MCVPTVKLGSNRRSREPACCNGPSKPHPCLGLDHGLHLGQRSWRRVNRSHEGNRRQDIVSLVSISGGLASWYKHLHHFLIRSPSTMTRRSCLRSRRVTRVGFWRHKFPACRGSRRSNPLSRRPRRCWRPLTATVTGPGLPGKRFNEWSPPTRPAGWRAGWPGGASRHMSSNPPVFRSTAGRGGPNPMASMLSCCCAHCWPGFGASRACAQWCRSPTKPMKMSAVASGSGRTWWLSGSASSIVSVPCWRRWGCVTTIRFGGIGVSDWTRCARRSGIRFRRTPAPEYFACSMVCAQIAELERERDAVLDEEAPGKAEEMIQQLAGLRGIGVQSATVLVREAFVREFANGKALGSYAGLTATPFSSGGTEREQGINKAGNRRLRTVMIELAWLWQRYQPGSAQVIWFRERVGGTGKRMRKVMVVAMARRLLIALWRFATQGVVPEGAVMKSVS